MKSIKYFRYLIRHKWYVMVECFRLRIYWQGLTHDLSKFLPDEFFPYLEYFYGDKNSIFAFYFEERFKEAWLLHQKRNKHHWQYWILRNDNGSTIALDMPIQYCEEMLADWIGAGLAINGKLEVKSWFEKNKANMLLSPSTLNWINFKLSNERFRNA